MGEELGRVRVYRFHQTWFRKASCDLCRGLLKRGHVEQHAEWHARRNEGGSVGLGTTAAFCDVSLTSILTGRIGDRTTFLMTRTGWVTRNTGPR